MEWDCGNCKNFEQCKSKFGIKSWELCPDWEMENENKDT
jgi:hypothetical protein